VRSQAVNGSTLCLQCGLCCDGTLFGFAWLDDDETARARALGLPVEQRVDKQGRTRWSFPQPCVRHQDGCCTIYDEQPRRCARYTCRLLDGYVEGSRSFDDCLGVVKLVREMAAEIPATAPSITNETRTNPETLMTLASLEMLYWKYFDDPEAPDASQ
jgi:hypothetical protein